MKGKRGINGRATAEHCYETFKKFLRSFGICIRCHVVAATTDGPTVMKKMRTYLECDHQECQLHGIQLGIKDVFMSKKQKTKETLLKTSTRQSGAGCFRRLPQ